MPHVTNVSSYLSELDFKSNIAHIRDNFELVRREEIAAFFDNETPFPRGKAFITLDDGLAEGYNIVRPILKKYDLPAIFFLTTNFIDNRSIFFRHAVSIIIEKARQIYSNDKSGFLERVSRFDFKTRFDSFDQFFKLINRMDFDDSDLIGEICEAFEVDIEGFLKEKKPYLSAEQIESLVRDGFFVGAHSLGHPNFEKLNSEEIEREIVRSCKIIAGKTGTKRVPFAFPHSSRGIDRELLLEIQKKHDVVGQFFDSVSRFNPDPFGIPRFDVDPFAEFSKKRDFLVRIILYFNIVKKLTIKLH
ncbi:polysaccharide deacetylase family protein [bacterium]|nr:polysaccharide deacetylase family protein [bacterium]